MTRYIFIGLIAFALVGAAIGYWEHMRDQAMQAGIDKQRAAEIAKSNQLIAERRALDATFDKMDAAAVCRDAGFSWVFADGKSHCE